MSSTLPADLDRAAATIANADAIVIGAGAGMGVDSGLPDFRGDHGFWNAYPPYRKLGLGFTQLAQPDWFRSDPALAWGFYGHRLELYRETQPHSGFGILKRWSERLVHGSFVYTSNVDGQFQRAGFGEEQIVECHGSIHRLQCLMNCGIGVFSADPYAVEINTASMRAAKPFPTCPRCGALARPAILMFGDWDYDDSSSREQIGRFHHWLGTIQGANVVVVECGAGSAISTVRRQCEMLARMSGGTLIRINPREPETDHPGIGLPLGARKALREIDRRLTELVNASLRS